MAGDADSGPFFLHDNPCHGNCLISESIVAQFDAKLASPVVDSDCLFCLAATQSELLHFTIDSLHRKALAICIHYPTISRSRGDRSNSLGAIADRDASFTILDPEQQRSVERNAFNDIWSVRLNASVALQD
jgi:hypothetical protein